MVPDRFAPVLAELAPLAERFAGSGHRLYLVGGSVRDLLYDDGQQDFDLDLTTDARPDHGAAARRRERAREHPAPRPAAVPPTSAHDAVIGLQRAAGNRAVAVSMATGPASALLIVDRLASEGALRASHLLPSVRGELLARLGRREEARAELATAAALAGNERTRALLLARAASL